MKNIGRFIGSRNDRKTARRLEQGGKHRQLRMLLAESLESRQLLAADLAPVSLMANHNYLVAEDVNADFQVTPSDALMVLNDLARHGAGELGSNNSAANRFTDVNADGALTPVDALIVLNRVNRGEGEVDPLLNIKLDVTQDGESILAENTRNFEVNVGEKFDVEVRYADLRTPVDHRLGVFSLYVDILASGIDSFRPVLSETQIIELSENLEDASGVLTIAFGNDPDRTAEIPVRSGDPSVSSLEDDPENAIRIAIEEGLGLGAGTVSVNQAVRSGRDTDNGGGGIVGTGDPFQYIIRFVGENAEFADIPNLIVNTDTITDAAVTGSLVEVPVYSTTDQSQINPNSLLYNIDFRSSTMGNRVVYGDVRSGVYNPGNQETFDEIGGVGPALENGLPVTENRDVLQNFEAFSIEMQAVRAQDNVTFTLDLPDNPIGSEIALYGTSASSDVALTDELISILLADDPETIEDERTGLVIGRFVIPTELPITAVTDNVNIPEDAAERQIDVLSNDLPSPADLNVVSVGPASHGTTRIEQGEVFYKPAADYFGPDTFTYEINDGTNIATGTVTVDVGSVNDPPIGQRILVKTVRGATVAIPYNSFLLPQPANENDTVGVTQVSAVHGDVATSAGRNLVYHAPTSSVHDDQISVTFSDGTATDTVLIDIEIIDPSAPMAVADRIAVNQNRATTFSTDFVLLNNDSVSTGFKRVVRFETDATDGMAATKGTVTGNANGTFTYTPPANLFGTAADSFRYVMSDGTNQSDPVVVTVDILRINATPIAGDVSATINTATNSQIAIDLTNAISPGIGEEGVPGETVQVSEVSQGDLGGQVSIAPGAQGVDYTPVTGTTGTETFTYTVADQLGLEAVGTITVTIVDIGGGGTGGTASISGVKFHDLNDNGARDAGEPTLPDWTIYLDLNNNANFDVGEPTSITDDQGVYRFDDLLASDYTVRELGQAGWRQSFPTMVTSGNVSVKTGDYAGFTTVADIDRDGDLDIIVANEYSDSKKHESNIVLLTNNGNGNFAQSTLPLPDDSRPQAVIADQDLTGDGIADMVVASAGVVGSAIGSSRASGLQLFVGTELGFDPVWRSIAAGEGPSDLVARDLNGDGIVDLLVTNHRSDDVSILLGTGGGNFAAPIGLATGEEPVALALTQLAKDGRDLLAVANYQSGSVSIFTGRDGSFELRETISDLTNPTDLLLVDINNDGKDDLVVADSGTDTIRTYLGNGKGKFTEFDVRAVKSGVSGDMRQRPEAIDVTDFNADGVVDLLIANRQGGESLWINNGNGTFRYASNLLMPSMPNFNPLLAKSIAVADLDGDAELDYVVAFAAGGVSIHTSSVSEAPGFYLVSLSDGEASDGNDFGNFQFDTNPTETVSLSVTSAAITENDSSGSSTVWATLSTALDHPVVVTLGVGGSATLGADYTLSPRQLTIAPGELFATATITSINDAIDEGAGESIELTIDSVIGALDGNAPPTTVTIVDDDTASLPLVTEISAASASVDEGESVAVTVTLSEPASEQVVVSLDYATGTATLDEDFTAPLSVVVPVGQTTGTLTLETLDDLANEIDESIIVEVVGVSGATEAGVLSTTVTIIDGDTDNGIPPVATLTASANSMDEMGGFVTFTATLDKTTDHDVVLDLTPSGTAALDEDYRLPRQLVISAGSLAGSVAAHAIDDLLDDQDESFTVVFSAAQGGTLSGETSFDVAIVDNDAPTVSLAADLNLIGEDGGIARITAQLSSAKSIPTIVDLSFAGTAVWGQHYTVQSSRIIIPAEATSGSILVQAINNQEIENVDRVIEITAIGLNTSTSVTIRNEDGVSFPLRAEGTPLSGDGAVVTSDELSALYAASIDIWQRAGLSDQGLDRLRDLGVEIEDLDGDLLGLAEQDRIAIDLNAAGFGWFVDATPDDDSEFQQNGDPAAAASIDLLSVILHEQGHLLGLDHGDSELMLESLAAGTRRTPSDADVDQALQDMF
ncbi:FG-GAP-like repeat-containing protein [Rosistilla ulvae]|nr:FG-GAP-like repeat-containing protein [Rosistilla ulvae]